MTASGRNIVHSLAADRPLPVLAALAAATLAIAYASQYLGGLEPCQLCLYQRWPWWAVLAIAGTGLWPKTNDRLRRALTGLCGGILLGGAALAFFHAGVEQGWWEGLASCGGGSVPGSLAEMQKMLNQPIVRCDQPAWTLFGVSMAGYNGLASLLIGGWAVRMAAARGKSRQQGLADG
ncbi:MAG: disulfide bond formation protein B [Alphaproteobacteria bacterium]|nr:disulfide bond formation protein B [Alphaproteobacteria bacterium]